MLVGSESIIDTSKGWILSYVSDAKTAALTVTLNANGAAFLQVKGRFDRNNGVEIAVALHGRGQVAVVDERRPD